MNRVKVGDEIKHIDQQTLLDNLDAFASKRANDRVYVTSPEGKRGTVAMRELRNVLDAGFQLIDDTEGYNNRPDIIEKRKSEQKQKAQEDPANPADIMASASGINDTMFGRTIGAGQNRGGMQQVISGQVRPAVEQAIEPAQQATRIEIPRIPGQTDLEYAESMMAAQERENKRYQEQLQEEARARALPESVEEIDNQIREIDSQLAQFEGSQERFITSPEDREIAQVFNFNRKRLSNEDKGRQSQLMEQRKALDVQRDLLRKFKKYEEYDKDADRNAIGRFFGGMAAGGDLQALATFGLTQMTRDMEFMDILAKAEKGIELTADESKAIQMYQNLQQIQSKDRGAFFSAGSGMQTTFEFMRDMALFGFGGMAKSAANQGVKQVLKGTLKNFAKKSGEIFLKAPLTPSFYNNLTANQVRNFEINTDADGKWDVSRKESALKNAYRTYAETTTEFLSEGLGNVFEQIGLVSRLARSAGKGKGLLSKAVKSYDRIHNKALHNKWGKFLLGGMQQMGLNNIPTEFLEEIAVIPMQSLLLWENQFDQLADPRFYQEVAISTAALGGMHSVVNLAAGGPSALIERRKVNKKIDQARNELEGLRDSTDDVEVKSAVDNLYSNIENRNYYNEDYEFTGEAVINDLAKIREVSSANPDIIKKTENFVQLALYKEGQTEAMRAIAENEIGRFEYGTSGGVMLAQTQDGENVFILDETGSSVTIRRQNKDAEPVVVPRSEIVSVNPLTIDSFVTDWFVGKRPGEIKLETVEDVQQMDQQAEQTVQQMPLSVGSTALYEGLPVKILDMYDGNVTIEDENGQTHTVAPQDLQAAPAVGESTVYILPDGRRGITAGKDNSGNYNLQILDDNGNFVDAVYVSAEDLMQYDKISAEEANTIEQIAQDPQAAVEAAAEQEAVAQEVQLPVDKDGNIDFDTLLVQSPDRFLQEFSAVVGEDRAISQLQRTAANIDEQIQQVTGKLEKTTSLNETVKLQNDINSLTRQKESIQAILGQGQEINKGTEEILTGQKEIIKAEQETLPVSEEMGTENEEISVLSDEMGTPVEEFETVEVENQTPDLSESVKTEPVKPKTILESALDNNANAALEQQGQQVNTEPTQGQKEAGNYKMGHIKINGYDITIENPKGSTRSGIDNNGIPWEVQMNNHYGYFRRTEGKDGDQIDVFIGDSPTSGKIFIVDQVDEKGNFDEHKVMMGFDSIEEAEQAYMSNYSPGWKGLGNITEVSQQEFKDWVKDGQKKTQPFAKRQENGDKIDIPQTEEVDEYGNHFVIASDGSSDFGVVDAESGLKHAPIKLSMGDNTVDEEGNNHGYGLLHIEAERGDAIRGAGYNSVQDFVESVAKNYTDIREGAIIANNQTYLLELVDEHNNTLFIQLSKNGEYWTINSAGIFRKKYSRNKPKVYNRPALGSDTGTDISRVNSGHIKGATTPAGNSPQTSESKGKQSSAQMQTPVQQESSVATKPAKESNRLISDDEYADLRKRMREKLSQLNVGIDPEMLSIGIKMAVYHIETGAYKFTDYTRKMVADLGDAIRPYLKAFYNGVRDLPEAAELAKDMDSYADVAATDVNAIAMEDAVEVTAELQPVEEAGPAEQEPATSVRGTVTKDVNTKTGEDIWVVKLNDRVERDEYNQIAGEAKAHGGYYSRFKKGFIFKSESDANKFNNIDNGQITDTQVEQRTADTIAVVSQAEDIISEIGSQAEAVRTPAEAVAAIDKCDVALEKINDQLALLGYYEADYDDSKFNESYGYAKTAEKKALKDAEKLAKALAKDLGIDVGRKKLASANIAPAGGDIIFRLPLKEDRQLYVNISLHPNSYGIYDAKAGYDDLFVRGISDLQGRDAIMYRIENLGSSGVNRYGFNNFANADVMYNDLLSGIRNIASDWLPSAQAPQPQQENKPVMELVKPKEESPNPDFKVGSKVLYNGEPATITGIEMGRPVLDTGMGPVMYEIANWNELSKYEPQTKDNGKEKLRKLEAGTAAARGKGQPRVKDEALGGGQQPQVLSNEQAGVDTDSGTTAGNDTAGSRGVSERNTEQQNDVESSGDGGKNSRNWRYPSTGTGIPTSPAARLKANMAAIETLRQLQESGAEATPEQMEILSRYSGWGGMRTYFNSNQARIPGSDAAKLKQLLTDEEYNDAVMSLNSAYYTPAEVINTLWDVAAQLGFNGGNILEGSAGTGNILGLMPEGISSNSNIEAVEIDSVSGSILSYLYPDAKTHVQGFEKTDIPNGSVDLAITNVPFVTGLNVKDPIDKDLSRKFKDIHNFCIAKNVRKLREGGIGIFITSNGTLDKSKQLREWLVSREGNADVIGAFRLNNRTFEGAPVTSDIIVVRKRVGGAPSSAAIDVLGTTTTKVVPVKVDEKFNKKTGQYEDVTREVALDYNTYFQQHPENMGGEMAVAGEKGDTFRPASIGLYPVKGIDQGERMRQWVATFSPVEAATPSAQQAAPVYEQSGEKEGALVVDKDGRLCISRRGEAVPLDVNDNKIKGKYTKAEAVKDYNGLKKALADVLEYQTSNSSDEGLAPLLKKLNSTYDGFVKKYGPLNRNVTISFLRNDVDFASIAAVENYSESETIDGKKKIETSKTDVFKGRVVGYEPSPTPTSVSDGIILSVQKNGHIDPDIIAGWLDMGKDQVIEQVVSSRMGFINPVNGLLEVRHEYLSGNVREKLSLAKANNEDGRYSTNIEELEKVVPMDIPAHLIEFSLGSTWIDPKMYSDFVQEKYDADVKYYNINGVWAADREVYANNEKNRSAGVYSESVGKRVMGHELFAAAMNNTPITVSKTVKHYNGTTETITDKQASQMCTVRMQEIKEEFKDWARARMQADPELASQMTRIYNDKFNAIVPKTIDDVFTPERFEGANKVINLYPHQKKSVIRATTEPLMLAHEVGTGKTFTLITTAMEMRRLGTAKKPMIVVQNATVGQFVSQAKFLYPNAKVLTVGEKDRTAEGRKEFYAKIKYNDWDIIVVPQSVFEMIPDNEERMRDFVQEKIDEKMYAIEAAREAGMDSRFINQMESELKQLEDDFATGTMNRSGSKKNEKKEAIAAQNAAVRAEEQLDRTTDDVEDFDAMGIDALLVDEVHEYKHLGFSTSMKRGVKGVDPSYSKKAASVYLKTRAVLEKSSGKNVVFATGTPISNTAAEIWTFMRYLMPKDTMVANDIYYFDDFVRNFGNITQNLEFATNGKFKENTRFASYVNLPELVRLWGSVSDTVLTKDVGYVNDKVPDMESGKAMDIFLPQSPGLVDIMRGVRTVLENYDKMSGKEKKANSYIPLTMYGIAKRAAIDPRLVDSNAIDEPLSKTNRAVEETLRTLKETQDYKGTVAIFCDSYRRLEEDVTGKKKETFNLFQEIKRKLVAAGVPAGQIVIMESGMTVSKKEKVFADVNAGNVRVILGSTQTLGTGVNIQQRLHTLIHMDAPDRPMDYTQRNGRILRQGNLHKEWGKEVRVLRFGVEDSLDVTSYQRLKTKSSFIDSVMDSKPLLANNQENRTLEEEEEGLFDNPVAVLSGSQYALLKSQAERELRKWQSKYKQWEADQVYVNAQLKRNEGQLERNAANQQQWQQSLAQIKEKFPDGKVGTVSIDGVQCTTEEERIQAYKDINKKMNDVMEKLRNNPYGNREHYDYTLEFDGMPVEVSLDLKRESRYNEKIKGVQVSVRRDMKYSIPELKLADVPVSGAYIKGAVDDILENVVTGKDIQERLDAAERGTKRLQEENKLLSVRDGKPFEFTSELEDARKKVDEYTELMKKELAEKEAKYAEQGTGATVDVENVLSEDESGVQTQIDQVTSVPELSYSQQLAYDAVREALSNANIPIVMATDEMAEEVMTAKESVENEGDIRFSIVTDSDTISKLDSEPTMKVYRAMQVIDGELYPPMSAMVNGKLRAPTKLGVWEQAEENPELADDNGYFKLNKGNKKSLKARYNPYIHTSTTPLNDQFSEAQNRPNLVTVEVEIPVSELSSGYKADKAKDPVGRIEWKAGVIQSKISGKREVILSRWDKPIRIVPDSEVAEKIIEMFDGRDITMPSNVVTPSLRNELEKRGINFIETNNTGKPVRFSIDSAENGGMYSKTEFKNVFGIPDVTLSALLNADIVNDNESNLYGWNDDLYRQIYADYKGQIDNLAQGTGLDGQSFITQVSNPYRNIDYAFPADYFALQNSLENLSVTERQQILDKRFPQIAAARENNRKWSEAQRKVGRANIENRKAIAENVRSYFDSHILEYASAAYQEKLSTIDNHISKWQSHGKSIPQAFYKERGNVIKEFLDKIGTVPAVMVSENDFGDIMSNNGVNSEDIEEIRLVLEEEQIPGVFLNGKVFMFSDVLTDIPDAHEVYIHERQHGITHKNFRGNVNNVLSRIDSEKELENIVVALSGNENYRGLHRANLADEFLSFAMALSYTNSNFADELSQAGVNEQLIEYINEYSRSQWQKADLSKSRRRQKSYSPVRVDEGGNSPQDVRDTGERSSQMGQQGLGSVQGSQTGAGERKFFKSRVGTVRGWTKGGVIYLTKDGLNPDTPIHEYTHIWADAVQKFNPALWNNVKSLLKRLPQWQQVVSDVNYQDIAGNEDAVASEVLARYSGKRGAKRLEQDAKAMGESTGHRGSAARLLERVKEAIAQFWDWVNINLFNLSGFSSAEEVADRVLYDLVSGTDLNRPADITTQILDKSGTAQLLGAEAHAAMMDEVFGGMEVIQQARAARGDKAANTREYISQVCENVATRGDQAMKIAAAVRAAFTDKGMRLDMSDAALLHQMWKECNTYPDTTVKERLEQNNRSNKVRFSIEEDMGPVTNDIKLGFWEARKEKWVDRMHSVAVLKKIITTRHGKITSETDPYMSENLASSRSMYEIDKFKKDMYEPLLNKVVEIQQLFLKKGLVKQAKLAYKAVNDYLYALHAPERNKHICVEEVVDKMMKKLSKEELKHFKSSDHLGVLTALVSRLYNERQDPGTPFTSDMFANNIIKGASKDKEENNLRNEFRKKFTDLVKTSRSDMDKIFKSKRGNNRSGMSDKEAAEIVKKYRTADMQAALDELSAMVQRCNDFTLDTWLKYSMIDKETYDNYKNMYQHYIPLRNWADKEDVDYDSLGKHAFNHASEIVNLNRKAQGRSSRADDPLAYIASLAQSAVVVGNKNMVHLNAFRLVQQNKDILEDIAILPQIYYVQVEGSEDVIAYDVKPPQELFDKGLVTTKTNRSYRWHKTHAEYEAHTVPVIIDGTRYMVVFKGDIGIRIASALNNTNVNHWAAADALRPLTRWLSAVRTSYSPEFVLVNFVRDFLFGNIAYGIEGGNALKLNRNLASAFKAINRAALGKEPSSALDRMYEEFQREGGQTGFIHMRKIEQIKKENEIMRRKLSGEKTVGDWVLRNWMMRFGKSSMEYLSVMSENAMRFAVYMTERQKGVSAKDAAYKAHEITVNFNRKGTLSGNMGAFYSFFNASVQGTYRLWQLGKNYPKRTAVAITSLALTKVLAAAISAMIGGDDYDELSDYVKFSNMIIPIGEDDNGRTVFFTLPMPQGMRAFTNLADVTVDAIRGTKTVGEGISTWMLNAVGEFAPLAVDAIDLTGRQSGQSIVAPFVPTAVQPFFDVWSNKDFKGDPIYKEDFTKGTEDYTPEYKKVYSNANPALVKASKILNRLGGGSDELSSAIKIDRETGTVSRRWYGYALDWNPARTEHIIDGYLGGMATFFSNILKTGKAVISEDVDLEYYSLPIAGRFTRQAFYKDGYDTWYEVSDMVKDIEATEKAMEREKDWDSYALVKGYGFNAELSTTYHIYDDRVKQLQDVIKSGNLSPQERREYSQMLDNLISEAAGMFEEIMTKYEEN